MRISILFVLLWSVSLNAQQTTLPLNFELQNSYEKSLLQNDKLSFTAQRPLLYSDVNKVIDIDSIHYRWGRDADVLAKMKHPMWWRKLRTEDLISIKRNDFELKINPLMNFSSGKTSNDSSLMINTRGVDIQGNFGSKFSFRTGMYENQAYFPDYYTNIVNERKIVPGQGRARVFKDKGYDFSQAYGNVSFSPSKLFNFQLGHGKHFIGEGYRSLILSDNAFNMPYAKWTTTWKRLRYTNLLVAYQNTVVADGTSEISNRRYGSVTSLDFLIGNFMEIGITESIVWQKKDSLAYFPDANYYNPFIMFRTFQYGMNHKNNVLLGINSKIKISKSILAYFQLVYDDTKKSSYQVGVKWYDVLKLPLFMQLEYNVVNPYTYSHWDKQSYTHYNQELSHPLGANFSEIIGRWRFNWKDFIVAYQFNYAKTGLDTAGINYGSNILIPNSTSEGSSLHQGLATNITNHSIKLAFLVNPSSNLQIYFEYRTRSLENEVESLSENYWLFGLKTNLNNLYSDF